MQPALVGQRQSLLPPAVVAAMDMAEDAERKAKDAERKQREREAESSAAAADRKAKNAGRKRKAQEKELPAAAADRKQRNAVSERARRAKAKAKRAAQRVQQLQDLMIGSGSDADGEVDSDSGCSSSSGELPPPGRAAGRMHKGRRNSDGGRSSSGGGPPPPGSAAGKPRKGRRDLPFVKAMQEHLGWHLRRPDNPVAPKLGPYVEEAIKGFPARQQDLPAGQHIPEVSMKAHVDIAVKLAHAANHHMPDSVCACCSEMVAPAAYMLMLFQHIPNVQLTRADIKRTNAVIRPAKTVHERSVPCGEVSPPPDPVLPVGLTQKKFEVWTKLGHTLPFDQPHAPPKQEAAAAAVGQGEGQQQQQPALEQQRGTAGVAGTAAAALGTTGREVEMQDPEGRLYLVTEAGWWWDSVECAKFPTCLHTGNCFAPRHTSA